MKIMKFLEDNLLLILTLIGVLAGIGIGLAISFSTDDEPKMTPRNLNFLILPGTLLVCKVRFPF